MSRFGSSRYSNENSPLELVSEEGDIPESEGWEGREPELDQWGISSGGFGGEP